MFEINFKMKTMKDDLAFNLKCDVLLFGGVL